MPSKSSYQVPAATDAASQTYQNAASAPCLVCSSIHPLGYCPLKRAGVEYCGLCGIAHFGAGSTRNCPHLNSVTQCRAMLETLKSSPEPRAEVEQAKRYLVGIIGNLNRKKKMKAVNALQPPTLPSNNQIFNPYAANGEPVIAPLSNGITRPGKENRPSRIIGISPDPRDI